jgi:hypothetical protein
MKKEFQLNLNEGFLHKSNDEKGSDFYGTINIENVIFDISGWNKKSEKSQFISLSVWDNDIPYSDRKIVPFDSKNPEKLRNNVGVLFLDKNNNFYGEITVMSKTFKISGDLFKGSKGSFIKLKVKTSNKVLDNLDNEVSDFLGNEKTDLAI